MIIFRFQSILFRYLWLHFDYKRTCFDFNRIHFDFNRLCFDFSPITYIFSSTQFYFDFEHFISIWNGFYFRNWLSLLTHTVKIFIGNLSQSQEFQQDKATITEESIFSDQVFGTPSSSIFDGEGDNIRIQFTTKASNKLKTPFRNSLASLRRSMPILTEVSEKNDKLIQPDVEENSLPTPEVTIPPLNLELTPMPKSSDCNAWITP